MTFRARSPRGLGGLALLLALSATPALAQQATGDPFAAVVADTDADAPLNAAAFPVRNPTQAELRQYLEAFRVINLAVNLKVGGPAYAPLGEARVGPLSAPSGTILGIKAGFDKRPGEKEAVLRTLELVPTLNGKQVPVDLLGPFARFDSLRLDGQGVLHLKLSGVASALVREVTIEKIYRDAEKNLVIKAGGKGLLGGIVGDIRVRPDGSVERWSGGFLGIGRGWKAVKVADARSRRMVPLKLDQTLPIEHWPPRAGDILAWLPAEGAAGTRPNLPPLTGNDPTDPLRPILNAIPISDLDVSFTARADTRTIRLDGPAGQPGQGGQLTLSDHELEFRSRGTFNGRTYHSTGNPNENRIKATGTIEGEVISGESRARINRASFSLTGTHGAVIPFENLAELELSSDLKLELHAALSGVSTHLPNGSYLLAPGSLKADFSGDAKLVLTPLSRDGERSELRIDPNANRFSFSAEGPVTLGGLDKLTPGSSLSLPGEVRVVAADDPSTPGVDESRGPVLRGEGKLGTKAGLLVTKTELRVDGRTTTAGLVGVLEERDGERQELRTTLKPGAELHLYAYTFMGVRKDVIDAMIARSLDPTAANAAAANQPLTPAANMGVDLRLRGTAENTRVATSNAPGGDGKQPEFTILLPGETELGGRVAASLRSRGPTPELRRVAASVDLTSHAPGTFEGGLPGGPQVRGELGEGTSLHLDTGVMSRTNPRGTELSTAGLAEGQKAARLEAHLVLTQGSVAYQELTAAFQGRATVDLKAALGMRIDPAPLLAGQPTPDLSASLPIDLALSLDLAAGSTFRVRDRGQDSRLTLGGPVQVTLHTSAEVQPTTGAPVVSSLSGLDVTITAGPADLQAILAPLGRQVSMTLEGASTVHLRRVNVAFLPSGEVQIRHGGITVEIAPGAITLGGPRR